MRLDSPLTKLGHGIVHRKRIFQLLNVLLVSQAVDAWRARLGLVDDSAGSSHTHGGNGLTRYTYRMPRFEGPTKKRNFGTGKVMQMTMATYLRSLLMRKQKSRQS